MHLVGPYQYWITMHGTMNIKCPTHSRIYPLHFLWNGSDWSNIGHIKTQWLEGGGGNRGCSFYRSHSGMTANQTGSRSVTTTRDRWKMNTKLLKDASISILFQQDWTSWGLQEGKYTGMDKWVKKYVKRKILLLFIKEGSARTREDMINENFHFASICDILKDRRLSRQKHPQ